LKQGWHESGLLHNNNLTEQNDVKESAVFRISLLIDIAAPPEGAANFVQSTQRSERDIVMDIGYGHKILLQ